MLGTQEAIRQSQAKERRERHRARRCNLIVLCVKSSSRSQELDGRQVCLRNNKLYVDTVKKTAARQDAQSGVAVSADDKSTTGQQQGNESGSSPSAHPFAGYFLPYPDSPHEGLVSTITSEAPILNWIYIDKNTSEVRYGVRVDAQPHLTGPFDCTELDRRLTLDGWEGFCAVEEEPHVWALYFDKDDNGLKGKVKPGKKVLEIEISRRERRKTKQLVDEERAENAEKVANITKSASAGISSGIQQQQQPQQPQGPTPEKAKPGSAFQATVEDELDEPEDPADGPPSEEAVAEVCSLPGSPAPVKTQDKLSPNGQSGHPQSPQNLSNGKSQNPHSSQHRQFSGAAAFLPSLAEAAEEAAAQAAGAARRSSKQSEQQKTQAQPQRTSSARHSVGGATSTQAPVTPIKNIRPVVPSATEATPEQKQSARKSANEPLASSLPTPPPTQATSKQKSSPSPVADAKAVSSDVNNPSVTEAKPPTPLPPKASSEEEKEASKPAKEAVAAQASPNTTTANTATQDVKPDETVSTSPANPAPEQKQPESKALDTQAPLTPPKDAELTKPVAPSASITTPERKIEDKVAEEQTIPAQPPMTPPKDIKPAMPSITASPPVQKKEMSPAAVPSSVPPPTPPKDVKPVAPTPATAPAPTSSPPTTASQPPKITGPEAMTAKANVEHRIKNSAAAPPSLLPPETTEEQNKETEKARGFWPERTSFDRSFTPDLRVSTDYAASTVPSSTVVGDSASKENEVERTNTPSDAGASSSVPSISIGSKKESPSPGKDSKSVRYFSTASSTVSDAEVAVEEAIFRENNKIGE